MSRIINRLAEATGGWEVFLYQTLRGLCKDISGLYSKPSGITPEPKLAELLEEAVEIITAYESLAGGHPDGKKIEAGYTEIRTEGGPEKVKTARKPKVSAKDVEWKLEDLILTPPPRPPANSKSQVGRVFVDKDIGASQGELPLPANHKLVNRQAITITTVDGMVLGTGCAKSGEEGQIKSQNVTGHVSVTGKYRLAFTDTTLGGAHIGYEVVALPSKMTSKQYENAIALANKLSVEELQERLKHFGMVYQACLCGKRDCYGWQIVDQAVEEEGKAQHASRLQAARNLGVGGA